LALNAGAVGLSLGRGVPGFGKPARSRRVHGIRGSHRRDSGNRLAHGSGYGRSAGRCNPRGSSDSRLGGADESFESGCAGRTAAPAIEDPQRYNYGSHLLLAAAWAAMFGVSGFLAQGRSTRALVPMLWSAAAVFVPLAMLIALYYRIAELDRSLPFAGLALLLAAIYAVATETQVQRQPRPGLPASAAIFATATLAALALALTFALERGWLTVGLALMAPGAAWVAEKRRLPALRWLAAIMVAVTVARIGYEPRIVGTDLGTTPILNWLLYGYGAPALSFWVAGWLLRRRADDLPARITDAGAILFTVLLVIFEVRHAITCGDIYRPVSDITEAALDINAGLALTIGLERIRGRTGSIVHNVGALLIAGLTLVAIVFELIIVAQPRFANSGRRRLLQHNPAQLRPAGGARHHAGADRPHDAADAVPRRRRDHGGDAGLVLPHAANAAAVPRPNSGRANQRRRTILLFDGLAGLRHRTAGGRLFPALTTGAIPGAWRHHADHRQGIHHRYREHQRHLPRAFRDRARRCAARHRLALSAPVVPAHAGYGGNGAPRLKQRHRAPGSPR
jgi:hypothetical protein